MYIRRWVQKLRESQTPLGYAKLKEKPQVQRIYGEIEEIERDFCAGGIPDWCGGNVDKLY